MVERDKVEEKPGGMEEEKMSVDGQAVWRAVMETVAEVMPGSPVEADRISGIRGKVRYSTELARMTYCYALHDICGCSYKEVCEITGLTSVTAMRGVRMTRIRMTVSPVWSAAVEGIKRRLGHEG